MIDETKSQLDELKDDELDAVSGGDQGVTLGQAIQMQQNNGAPVITHSTTPVQQTGSLLGGAKAPTLNTPTSTSTPTGKH